MQQNCPFRSWTSLDQPSDASGTPDLAVGIVAPRSSPTDIEQNDFYRGSSHRQFTAEARNTTHGAENRIAISLMGQEGDTRQGRPSGELLEALYVVYDLDKKLKSFLLRSVLGLRKFFPCTSNLSSRGHRQLQLQNPIARRGVAVGVPASWVGLSNKVSLRRRSRTSTFPFTDIVHTNVGMVHQARS
jgi:hypothetical protein